MRFKELGDMLSPKTPSKFANLFDSGPSNSRRHSKTHTASSGLYSGQNTRRFFEQKQEPTVAEDAVQVCMVSAATTHTRRCFFWSLMLSPKRSSKSTLSSTCELFLSRRAMGGVAGA